jgi:pimeloyl-ACP methyl ester carboxylesterase
MPKVKINAVNIYFESHGDGFPLILSYGLGGNTGMWAEQIEAFSKYYRFIIWDPRGHGQSDSPLHRDQYGMKISADDLEGLLNHLGIEKAHIGGLSMGGGIATRFALEHPERIAGLLIIDSASASGLPMKEAMRKMRLKTIELVETLDMGTVAEYVIKSNPNLRTQAEASPEARQRLRQMFLDLNPIGYANTIRALIEETFSLDRLSAIKSPTLVLVGEEDPAIEAARLIHNHISGSKLTIISGAGHLSNLDCPTEFNKTVLEFLNQIELRWSGNRF